MALDNSIQVIDGIEIPSLRSLQLLYEAANKLVKNQCELRMLIFRKGEEVLSPEEANTCNTAACFLGWMPALGIKDLEAVEEDFKINSPASHLYESAFWDAYCRRVFGIVDLSGVWSLLFSGFWNNDVNNALNRVKYLILTALSNNKKVRVEGIGFITNRSLNRGIAQFEINQTVKEAEQAGTAFEELLQLGDRNG